jgi:hypothetical protein
LINPLAATPSRVRVAATVVPPSPDELLPPPPQATKVIANEHATAILLNLIMSSLKRCFIEGMFVLVTFSFE